MKMQSFLEGPKAALVASKDFDNGHYKTTPQHGIRAFGRVYSAWAYGQTVCYVKAVLIQFTPSDLRFQWYRHQGFRFSEEYVINFFIFP